MSRRRFVALVSGLALVALGVVAGLVVLFVTQTDFGRDRVRDALLSRVKSSVNGRMYVGRIRGGLFGGVVIDSIEIRDRQDSLLLASGPITVEYDPRDLLDKRILLTRLELTRPVFHARRHENDEWNFRRVFSRGGRKGPRGVDRNFGDFIVADSVTVRDGTFILTMPWHAPDTLRGAQRDSAIRAALDSDSREVRRTKEGYARTWRWTGIDGVSPYLRIADPDSGGKLVVINDLSFREADPPFLFSNIRGAARIMGDSVWLEVPHWDLPGSTGRASGKVVWGSGKPVRYAMDVVADSVSLDDVAWVYPTLPRTGGGSLHLSIRNDPSNLSVIDYSLSRMDVRTTSSRLRGRMTFAVGGTILAVKNVDVVAQPVDFALLRALNGKPFPVDWRGAVSGTLRAAGGPLNRFRVDDARLVFADGHVPGAITSATARGELDILYPAFTVFRGLSVDVERGDLRTVQHLYPNFPKLLGTLAGRATLDSSWLDVRFRDANVTYTDGPGEPTRMTGSGRVTYGELFMTYDAALDAQPLSLTALARSYPMLPLRGLMRGPIRVAGTVDSLDVTTTLSGSAGTLSFDGRLDAYPPGYAVRGRTTLTNLDARVLLERADVPATSLTATFDTDLRADSLANVVGRLAADVASGSVVDGVRIYAGRARLTAQDGVLRSDSLVLETSAATLYASGGIGLAPGTSDSLRVAVFVDSLGGLRRWIATTSPTDSLEGSLAISAVLGGSMDALAARGEIVGRSLYRAGARTDSLRGVFALRDLSSYPSGQVELVADGAMLGTMPIRSADASLRIDGPDHFSGSLVARGATGQWLRAVGDVRMRGDSVDARLDSLRLAVEERAGRPASNWTLAAPATIGITPAVTTLSPIRLVNGTGGALAVRATLPLQALVDVQLVAERVPLTDLSVLGQLGIPLSGAVSARVSVTGTRADPAIEWNALLQQVSTGTLAVDRVDAQGRYGARRFDGSVRVFRRETPALVADLSLPMDLALQPRAKRLLDEPLRGTVRADSADLAVVETFVPGVRVRDGRLVMGVSLGGTWGRPTLDGRIAVAGGALSLPALGVHMRQVAAEVRMRGDSIALDRFAALSDGGGETGSLSMRGYVHLDVLGHEPDGRRSSLNPGFTLDIESRNFHVISQRSLADLRVSARGLRLAGSLRASTLTGTVVVDKGVIYIPELARKRVIDLNDPDFYDVVDTSLTANRVLLPDAPATVMENLALQNVRLVIGPEVWIRSAEANIQLGGEVGVTKGRDPRSRAGEDGPQQLALQGTLTADRGQYRLDLGRALVRTFDVTRGRLTFAGDPDINPGLDISAVHTVRTENNQDIRVRVAIRGTLAQPQLLLSSDEGLQISQTDLVSYLAFGKPSFEVVGTGVNNADLAAAALAATAGGLVEGVLQERLGSAIDVFRIQTGIGQYAGDRTETARDAVFGSRVTFGKQLNERTFIGVDAGLCELNPWANSGGEQSALAAFRNRLGLKVDHRLAHGFSVSAGYEPSAKEKQCQEAGGQLAIQPPRQFGLDLFRTWSF